MNWLKNERRRLRRIYLKKAAHRTGGHYSVDRWLDWEFARTGIPAVTATIIATSTDRTLATDLIFATGLVLSVLWFGFVIATWVAVAARLSDKQYMLITRKQLSKEYRR